MTTKVRFSAIDRRKFLTTTAAAALLAGVSTPKVVFCADKVVKIGFLAPLTGAVAAWGKPGLDGLHIWADRINGAGGMCERLRGLGDAWRDPVLAERGLVGELDGGPFDFPLPVVSLARPGTLKPGPRLGQHTDEVLREL